MLVKIIKPLRSGGLFVLLCCVSSAVWSECVILLHGLARSESSMSELATTLSGAGFHVVNDGYPSRETSIETLAKNAVAKSVTQCNPEEKINFVTHSMGGILVRQYLHDHNLPNLHRVVMLGPPNQGSEVIDKLGEVPGFHFINGDAGLQLGTGEASIPNQLGPVTYEVGIIAGTRSINWILSSLIPGQDDGKVSVERTKVQGMNDHLIMPVTHPMMMNNDKVIEQVIFYLRQGEFKREDVAAE